MPSQQQGFLRRQPSQVGMRAGVRRPSPWKRAHVLVDSGSQQPPLVSLGFARELGLRQGRRVAGASQAGGASLPLYDVGTLQLAVGGRPSSEVFYAAPITPYDIILGESWLLKHGGILDYSTCQLLRRGVLDGEYHLLDLSSPPVADGVHVSSRDSGTGEKSVHVVTNGGSGVSILGSTAERGMVGAQPVHVATEGGSGAGILGSNAATGASPFELPVAHALTQMVNEQRMDHAMQQPSMEPDYGSHSLLTQAAFMRQDGVPGNVVSPPGARLRRIQRRQAALCLVQDFAKELPEDEMLELGDIPGLTPAPKDSFSYVRAEVNEHLSDSSAGLRSEVLQRLGKFEDTVFETRVMPRAPPHRVLDLDVTLLPGTAPIARRPYPVAAHHQAELRRQEQVLLDAGIIRHSVSAFAAPVLFAPKKDGKLRLCIDYRLLNAQTVRDRFPTPTANDLISRTRGAKLFSKVDLHSGFHQLRMREGDIHKTAFVTPNGHYEWTCAPFGLSATPSAFQRFMSLVLRDHIQAGYCVVYCDDIAIFSFSDNPLDHLANLEGVLGSLREHQLLAKGAKCEFFRREMEFLGFMVSGSGVRPVEAKVEAITRLQAPETISHLRSFLGMTNFFHSHIPAYSEVSAPLTDLLKGTVTGRRRLPWSVSCQTAFERLKTALVSAPVLRHFDPNLRTAVHVDGSQNAVGAVLLQWEEGELTPRPVCFLSRKLQGAQYRYDARNVEALAAQLALSAWRPLLYGVKFELMSDHSSLTHLFTQKSPSQRILRMCEFFADFDFQVVQFVRGADAMVPDFLSRPWEEPTSFLHVLSHSQGSGASSLLSFAAQVGTSVAVLGVNAAGSLLARWKGDRLHLFSREVEDHDTEEQVVASLMQLGGEVAPAPVLCRVGGLGGVGLWRADFGSCASMPFPGAIWVPVAQAVQRGVWAAGHFECLAPLGVFQLADEAGILPAAMPGLGASGEATGDVSPLIAALQEATPQDGFLSEVLKSVQDSCEASWRDFSFDASTKLVYYQRAGDPMPRICVPASCRGDIMREAHGGNVLAGHPGIARTTAQVARFYYWPGLHADVAHFVRTCITCAAVKPSTQLRLGSEEHAFSTAPSQPFTHWSMDLIGPMPLSRTGNAWIVTWVDRTTKLIVAEALKAGDTSAADLARLTFRAVCCQYGLPEKLTHDNDVRFASGLWKELWRLVGTKLKFTSSYNPQSDPAERANRQVLEALRAAVSTVTQYDEWDAALPHICFGLNSHTSTATRTSAFELAYGFPPRVPLNLGLPAAVTAREDVLAADFALQIQNRHQSAADQVAAAQVRIGRILDARSTPATIAVGDLVWMDGAYLPHQIPSKLANKWFGPYRVLSVHGVAVRLDLPAALGKVSNLVNMRRLKFFEPRDSVFGESDLPLEPLQAGDGVQRWEVRRILGHRLHKQREEMYVEWAGYDQSWASWVHRDSLLADVPALVAAYDATPSAFQARRAAPKRATKGRQLPAPRPPVALRASARLRGVNASA